MELTPPNPNTCQELVPRASNQIDDLTLCSNCFEITITFPDGLANDPALAVFKYEKKDPLDTAHFQEMSLVTFVNYTGASVIDLGHGVASLKNHRRRWLIDVAVDNEEFVLGLFAVFDAGLTETARQKDMDFLNQMLKKTTHYVPMAPTTTSALRITYRDWVRRYDSRIFEQYEFKACGRPFIARKVTSKSSIKNQRHYLQSHCRRGAPDLDCFRNPWLRCGVCTNATVPFDPTRSYFLVFALRKVPPFRNNLLLMHPRQVCQYNAFAPMYSYGLFHQELRTVFHPVMDCYTYSAIAIFGYYEPDTYQVHLRGIRTRVNVLLNDAMREVKTQAEALRVYNTFCHQYDFRLLRQYMPKRCGWNWERAKNHYMTYE